VSRFVVIDAEINKRGQGTSIVYTLVKCRKITEKSISIFVDAAKPIAVYFQNKQK
jgi:hypothetical protein